MNKKQSRLRRGRQTRAKIAVLRATRLSVHRTNLHIYANIIGPDARILASSSMWQQRRWSAKEWPKKHCRLELQRLLLIVPVFVITAVSKHWLKLLVKQV